MLGTLSPVHARELRRLSPDALRARASELAREIGELKFGGQAKEKNVKKLRALRHERARALTVLQEWEREP